MATNTTPTLSGSEKQVSWANEIREQAVRAYSEKMADPNTTERRAAGLRATLAHIEHETLAVWFIDRRRDLAAVKPDLNPMTDAETLSTRPRTTPYRCACIAEFRHRAGFDH